MNIEQPYTPTIQSVRDGYVWLSAEDNPVARELAGEDFDRFIAQVRRDAAREALDGLADQYESDAFIRIWRDAHYPEETR